MLVAVIIVVVVVVAVRMMAVMLLIDRAARQSTRFTAKPTTAMQIACS